MNLSEAITILEYNKEVDFILMNVSGSYGFFALPKELQGKYNAFERDQIIKDLVKSLLLEK